MIRAFRHLIEKQIQKARLSGRLEGLEGEGRPLPNRPGDAHVDAGDAAGFRIMAEAGVLPEEIELRKQIEAHKQNMAGISNPEQRKAAMQKLADLELRYNISKESRKKFLGR